MRDGGTEGRPPPPHGEFKGEPSRVGFSPEYVGGWSEWGKGEEGPHWLGCATGKGC